MIRSIVMALLVTLFVFALPAAIIIGYKVFFESAELNFANYHLGLYLLGGIFLVFVVFFLFRGRK